MRCNVKKSFSIHLGPLCLSLSLGALSFAPQASACIDFGVTVTDFKQYGQNRDFIPGNTSVRILANGISFTYANGTSDNLYYNKDKHQWCDQASPAPRNC